jgi:hypothetical protein
MSNDDAELNALVFGEVQFKLDFTQDTFYAVYL